MISVSRYEKNSVVPKSTSALPTPSQRFSASRASTITKLTISIVTSSPASRRQLRPRSAIQWLTAALITVKIATPITMRSGRAVPPDSMRPKITQTMAVSAIFSRSAQPKMLVSARTLRYGSAPRSSGGSGSAARRRPWSNGGAFFLMIQ